MSTDDLKNAQDKLSYHIYSFTIPLFIFYKEYLGIFKCCRPNIYGNLTSVIFSIGPGTKHVLPTLLYIERDWKTDYYLHNTNSFQKKTMQF